MKEDTRIKISKIILLIFGLILLGRLFSLQILSHEYYDDMATKQYVKTSGTDFKRGTIYFKQKDNQLMPMATLKQGYLIAITPKLIKDPEDAYKKLSSIVNGLDKQDFIMRVAKKDDPYEEVARKVSNEDAEKIKNLEIEGVSLYSEMWRFYPAKKLASRILGFVGFKGDKLAGRYGLESYYDYVLSRENNGTMSINFFAEVFSNIKKELFDGKEKIEGDIILSIEPSVQSFLETTLNETIVKWDAGFVGGIIMDPKTGQILAMSVKPDFDPNTYGSENNLSLFSNPIVESVFEMGSTMKPLTYAAAINEGKITSDMTYFDEGFIILNKKRIENYDKKGRGKVDLQTALSKSLNTGAIFVMQQIGKEKFKEYIINYGLGTKTGIDLPDELPGLISNLNSNQDVEFATASFGHGIAITPMQMAVALSSLANGGYIIEPHIVDEIKVNNGINKKIEPKIIRQVLKKETSEEISRMLTVSVDQFLLDGKLKMEHYRIAAKTGTAVMLDENGKYSEDKVFHSFVGYAPSYNAKFLVFLFMSDPKNVQYASDTLTHPFMNIMKYLINYYNLPPDR